MDLSNRNVLSLTTLIDEQLKLLRQDDLELIEQMNSIYDHIYHLRLMLTSQNPSTFNLNSTSLIDSLTPSTFYGKQRSDSEPNILSDRQKILTIIEDLQ